MHAALALPNKYLLNLSKEPETVALKFGGRHGYILSSSVMNFYLTKEKNFFTDDITQQYGANVCHYLNRVLA